MLQIAPQDPEKTAVERSRRRSRRIFAVAGVLFFLTILLGGLAPEPAPAPAPPTAWGWAITLSLLAFLMFVIGAFVSALHTHRVLVALRRTMPSQVTSSPAVGVPGPVPEMTARATIPTSTEAPSWIGTDALGDPRPTRYTSANEPRPLRGWVAFWSVLGWLVVTGFVVVVVFVDVFSLRGLTENVALHDGMQTTATIRSIRCDHEGCEGTLSFLTSSGRGVEVHVSGEDPVLWRRVGSDGIVIRYAIHDPTLITTDVGGAGPGTTGSVVILAAIVLVAWSATLFGLVALAKRWRSRHRRKRWWAPGDPVSEPPD